MHPERQGEPCGLLVAVVGPSGAGKDTLIRLALDHSAHGARIVLARRVVTRSPDGSTEDHDSLDEAAFDRAEAAGAFCLAWRAHGLSYGVPKAVEDEVRAGALVVANLSRRSLTDAARRFGRLAVVEITAPRDVLVERIAARGREAPADIARRLARRAHLESPPGLLSFLSIDNSGPAEDGAERLQRHILELAARWTSATS